jgi:hypothetical protein
MALDPLLVLVAILAAYRLTRLVVKDEVFGEHPSLDGTTRGTFIRKAVDHALYTDTNEDRNAFAGYLGKWYTCSWCTGWWASLAVVCLLWQRHPLELGVVGWGLVFAVAGGQGYIASRHNA